MISNAVLYLKCQVNVFLKTAVLSSGAGERTLYKVYI